MSLRTVKNKPNSIKYRFRQCATFKFEFGCFEFYLREFGSFVYTSSEFYVDNITNLTKRFKKHIIYMFLNSAVK
jgi:hypothetical protein